MASAEYSFGARLAFNRPSLLSRSSQRVGGRYDTPPMLITPHWRSWRVCGVQWARAALVACWALLNRSDRERVPAGTLISADEPASRWYGCAYQGPAMDGPDAMRMASSNQCGQNTIPGSGIISESDNEKKSQW